MPRGRSFTDSRVSSGRACCFRSGSGWRLRFAVLRWPIRRKRRTATIVVAATISGLKSATEIRRTAPTRCEQDARCHAWSFSYPRTENATAACWLKNRVPPRVEDKCCVTGVRGAGVVEPRKGPIEYSIDRLGGDYRNFDVPPELTGAACMAACAADNKCRAWTYVRPGYIAPARVAISRTGSRGRGKSRAAFRVSCASGALVHAR